MTVAFCGHGDAIETFGLKEQLYRAVELEIQNGADAFYLGGYGQFDYMAARVVWDLKKQYPHIKSILVLAYLNREVDMRYYDETTYPPLEKVPLRYAISKRNEWMCERADTVIAYVTHGWGGAAQMLRYAERKHIRIINLAEGLTL